VADRIKLQVWSEAQYRWRTVYVLPIMLAVNLIALRQHGFTYRVLPWNYWTS
jgi:hypothetical protein